MTIQQESYIRFGMTKKDILGVNDKSAGKASPLVTTDSTHLINILSQGINPWQFERELVKNAIEAGATKAYIGPDWVSVEAEKRYRYMIVGDGVGMSPDELPIRIRSLCASGKTLGIFNNYGVGARAATLVYSPLGVIYMSCKNGEWSMVRLFRDSTDGQFKLFQYESEDGEYFDVYDVPSEYKSMFRSLGFMTEGHGTAVILLGSKPEQDTYVDLVPNNELGVRGHVTALNRRFATLPNGFTLRVQEFSKTDKRGWPRTIAKSTDRKGNGGMRRTIKGLVPYVAELSEYKGTKDISVWHKGSTWTAKAHWFLLCPIGDVPTWSNKSSEDRPAWARDIKGNNKDPHALLSGSPRGIVGTLHGDELYDLSWNAHSLSQFGLHAPGTALKDRVVILIEPARDTGAHNDPSRSHLLYKQGVSTPPMAEWGKAFFNALPAPLKRLRKECLESLKTADVGSGLIDTYFSRHLRDIGKTVKATRTSGGFVLPGSKGSSKNTNSPKVKSGNPKSKNGRDKMPVARWTETDNDRAAVYNEASNELYLNRSFTGLNADIARNCKIHPEHDDDTIVEAVQESYTVRMVLQVIHASAYKKSEHYSTEDFRKLIGPEALTSAVLGAWSTDNDVNTVLSDKVFKAKRVKK